MPWDITTANLSVAPLRVVLTNDTVEGLRTDKIVASDVARTIPGVCKNNLVQYILDCVWAALEEDIPPKKVPVAVKAAVDVHELDVSSALANVFWLVWLDLSGDSEPTPMFHDASPHISRLVDVIKACQAEQLVRTQGLMSHLDIPLLGLLGFIPPAKGPDPNITFKKTCLSTTNRILYKMDRYNLFREESEGYSKLLTLLNNRAVSRQKDESKLRMEVTKLIGSFDLCPAKVLDCILGAVEFNPARNQVRTHFSLSKRRQIYLECNVIV